MNWMKVIKPNRNLKTQLTASFMLLSLITLILGYVLIYSVMLNILQNRSEQSVLRLFQQAEYSIMQFRSEIEKLSRTIIIDNNVQKILAEENRLSEVERIDLSVN